MNITDFNLSTPLPDIFPKAWNEEIEKSPDFMAFRNLDHFRHIVSNITQREDDACDMSYKIALDKLIRGISDFPETEQASIRNLVRSNLHKRGLITEEVYEAYRYSVDGTNVGVDVAKYANGEPDCVITPSVQYIDFFYELYISISYPYNITNNAIRDSVAKLLATIEELERQHIFIKIVMVLPIRGITNDDKNYYFAAIPLFSHKDTKSVSMMSSVLNDRLLRKFFFAILEELYGSKLSGNYGYAVSLKGTMNVGKEFNEVEFFEDIVKTVGA